MLSQMYVLNFELCGSPEKVKPLFRLKDPCLHPAFKIYKGICSCGQTYVGETKRNVETRWSEHDKPTKDSNPSKHLK